MRAVQFAAYGEPDVLELVDVPTPEAGPDQVRIRVSAAAVNPADPKWRQGMFQSFAPVPLPHIVGYDIAGVVDSAGSGASVKVGDRVVVMLGGLTKGGYAEYAVAPAADVAKIPAGMDFATAAALPTAGLTGFQMIEEHIRPSAGQTVLVTGAVGAVGRFATCAARRLGARVVAAVRTNQTEEARALGADEVVVLGQEWSGAPFDHVADTVGGAEVARLCRRLAPGGRIVTAATTPIDPTGLSSEPAFIAVHGDAAKLSEIVRIVAAGELPVPVARRLPLSAAAEAHRLVEAGRTGGKIVLEP